MGNIDDNNLKQGIGIYVPNSGSQEVILTNWKNGMKDGWGVQIKNNGVAFCGTWAGNKYQGSALYCWEDFSV